MSKHTVFFRFRDERQYHLCLILLAASLLNAGLVLSRSVLAQWRCEARIVMNLPAEAFTPPPKVASAVVQFVPRAVMSPACRVTTLGRVTAAAFGQRRKMLRQSLKQVTPMPELLLKEAGIEPTERAEQLTVADFARMAAILDRGGVA